VTNFDTNDVETLYDLFWLFYLPFMVNKDVHKLRRLRFQSFVRYSLDDAMRDPDPVRNCMVKCNLL